MVVSHKKKSATRAEQVEQKAPRKPVVDRRQRRAVETRLNLFRCAVRLFAERGFFNVTVEQITEAADVGKGTFFNYFESKDHVLGVLAEIQIGKVQNALLAARNDREAIRSVLASLVLSLAEEPGQSPELARAVISSFLTSQAVRDLIEGFMRQGRDMISEIVATGQTRGEIDPLLDKDSLALQLQRTVMGTILFWSLHGEPSLASSIRDGFQQFWRGVVPTSQEQKR
jgi:AcrR family transcriptional regulator